MAEVDLHVTDILQPLSSLLSGANNKQPVQILHKSFHDFLTLCACKIPEYQQFAIGESKYNYHLASLCLGILRNDLQEHIEGISYPMDDDEKLPIVAVGEVVSYACKFWIDHIAQVDTPDIELIGSLFALESKKIVMGAEVVASESKFPGLDLLNVWLQVCTICDKLCICIKMGIETWYQDYLQ